MRRSGNRNRLPFAGDRGGDCSTIRHLYSAGPTESGDARCGRAKLLLRRKYATSVSFIKQAVKTKRATESQLRTWQDDRCSFKNPPLLRMNLACNNNEVGGSTPNAVN